MLQLEASVTKSPDDPDGLEAYRAVIDVIELSNPVRQTDVAEEDPTPNPDIFEMTTLLRNGLSPALFTSLLLGASLCLPPPLVRCPHLLHLLARPQPLGALAQFFLTNFDLLMREGNDHRSPPLSLLVDDAIRCLAQAMKCEPVAFELSRLPVRDEVLQKSVSMFAFEVPSAAQESGPLCCLHGAVTLLLQNLTATKPGAAVLRRASGAWSSVAKRLSVNLAANTALAPRDAPGISVITDRSSTSYARIVGDLATHAAICANVSHKSMKLTDALVEEGVCAPLRALACSLRSPLYLDTSLDFGMSVVIDAVGLVGSASPECMEAMLGASVGGDGRAAAGLFR